MKNRVSRCIALMGTLLSLSSFAQVCNEVPLYKGGESGRMEQGMTFPESPEWSTNWGVMGNLVPPYIRWSGMKNVPGNWVGTMIMNQLPAYVQGGSLSLDVRVTQNAKVGVWLEGDFGKSSVVYRDIAANTSTPLQVSVSELVGSQKVLVQKLGVGLFNVPANQYTTFFVDNVAFSCGVGDEAAAVEPSFPYSDVVSSNPHRESRFLHQSSPVTSAAYDEERRKGLGDSTQYQFVLNESEHKQIQNFVTSEDWSAKQSRDGWFRSLYLVERNRLKEGVIANPKGLYYEASAYSAANENKYMPILVGNVDYGYRVCADTVCENKVIVGSRALVAGLPSSTVKGSRLKLYYDPYFVTTNRNSLPNLEIYSGGKWNSVPAKSELLVEFESAGPQKLKIRLNEGGLTVNQTLVVEVK